MSEKDLRASDLRGTDLAVRVRGLTKRYGDHVAVDGIDLDVERGETFALLGPNGAGKTTTVEVLEGHRRRDGGEVSVLGADPGTAGLDWRARIGVVLQSGQDSGALTVSELVRHLAGFYPAPRDPDEVIEAVGLTEKARTRARALSGGQRRRLDVALGIVGPSGAALPGRADHRLRPAGATAVLGAGALAGRRGHDDPAHHPLPGRGRAPRRPGRRHRPRPPGRGVDAGHAGRTVAGHRHGAVVRRTTAGTRSAPPRRPRWWPTWCCGTRARRSRTSRCCDRRSRTPTWRWSGRRRDDRDQRPRRPRVRPGAVPPQPFSRAPA